MKVSMCRASFAGKYCSTSNPLTSPAKRQAKADASKRMIGAMPERPASRLAQPSATVLPTGLIRPRPVTTTRLLMRGNRSSPTSRSGLLVAGGVIDRVLHGGDLLGVLVRNLDAELVFQRHHQFHRVQRIGPEVGHEGLLADDLGLFDAELLGNDLLDACFDVAHGSLLGLVVCKPPILAGPGAFSGPAAAAARSRSPAPDQPMYMPPSTCSSCPVT